MNPTEDDLRRRVEALEAENARLREFNELLQAQRKQHLDIILGPAEEALSPTEEELLAIVKNHVPGAGLKFFADLGIVPRKPS